MANTAWAVAVLGLPVGPLFASIAAEAIRKISEFGMQGHSNIAWAYDNCCVLDLLRPILERSLDCLLGAMDGTVAQGM